MRTNAFAVALMIVSAACGGSGGGSVGAVLGRDNETRALYVREVPEGLAADKAGLQPGDQLVMIDGLYVRDLSGKVIRERLRGDVGSPILLTFLRGNTVHHVTVTREKLTAHVARRPKEETIAP